MFSLAIQSGGESRRMGRDKGLISFRGRPLVQWMYERFQPISEEIFVTTNRAEEYGFLGLRLVGDILPERGALGGLYTALREARFALVGVVAVDMPFAAPNFFLAACDVLREDRSFAGILPSSFRGIEPFHAVYRKEACLPLVEAALHAGKWKVTSWMNDAALRILSPRETHALGAGEEAFVNVNTPQEVAAAERSRFL